MKTNKIWKLDQGGWAGQRIWTVSYQRNMIKQQENMMSQKPENETDI